MDVDEVPVEPAGTEEKREDEGIDPGSRRIPKQKDPDVGGTIKNILLIALLVVLLLGAGLFYMWRTGVNDLKGDSKFLIVVQEKGVAKAGTLYNLKNNAVDIVNVEELPAVSDVGSFYEEASGAGSADGLILIEVSTVSKLSTEPFLEYNGRQIPSNEVGGYITGELWDAKLAGEDPPWKFRAKLLTEWVEYYDERILDANYGSQVYNQIFEDYRGGRIKVHPRNNALLILKYIPVEKIIL